MKVGSRRLQSPGRLPSSVGSSASASVSVGSTPARFSEKKSWSPAPVAKPAQLSKQLADLGADVLELPVIRTEPPTELRAFAELVKDAHTYQWIVFTSPNGVDVFFEWFYKLYQDARSIGGVRIAAVGPGTAARVKAYHLNVDLMPEKHVAEALVKPSKKKSVRIENEMILWVRPEGARDVVAHRIGETGCHRR
jgi:uroporphyrinogen-III synthase